MPKDKLDDQAKGKEQDGRQEEDQTAKWLQTGRITVALNTEQREFMGQLHLLLKASPDMDGPVTPTVIFGMISEIAQESLVADGTIQMRERKSAVQLLREGKTATVAKGSAKTVSAGESAETPKGSDVGDQNDASERPMTSPDWRPLQYKIKCKGCGITLEKGVVGFYQKGVGALGKECCEAKAAAFLQGTMAAWSPC